MPNAKTMKDGLGFKDDLNKYAVLGRIDKYELVKELGEGGFGAVFLARDTVAGVDVAIKGLPPEVKHNASELEPIRANFALVKRLRHPNIVAVTDLHRAERVSYASKEVEEKLRVYARDTMVVMDYAPGATLAKWRKQFPDARVPLDKAVEITRQIASALDAAHAQKVLHRDVKPENVMVETRDDGETIARVLDFGLAAEIRSSMGRVSQEICDMSGTYRYMAPEQWQGRKQGAKTDQYALAVLFYELVVGEVPFASVFDCGDPAVMRLAVTTDAPDIPESLPKAVRRALETALAKKPDERFASCGDFVAALEGKKTVGRRVLTPPSRKGGIGKVFGALALIAAVAAGAWWGGQSGGVSDRLPVPVSSNGVTRPLPPKSQTPRTPQKPPKPLVVSVPEALVAPPVVTNTVVMRPPQTVPQPVADVGRPQARVSQLVGQSTAVEHQLTETRRIGDNENYNLVHQIYSNYQSSGGLNRMMWYKGERQEKAKAFQEKANEMEKAYKRGDKEKAYQLAKEAKKLLDELTEIRRRDPYGSIKSQPQTN